MIIIRLKAGMGNQMFQYAFGKQVAQKLNTDLYLDLTLLLDRARGKDIVYRNYDLDIFQLEPQFIISPRLLKYLYKIKSPKIGKLLRQRVAKKYNYIKEPHFHFSKDLFDHPSDNSIYEGWWQSEYYFLNIENKIKSEFKFRAPILPNSIDLLQQIQKSNSVCLNVRRTDFLKVDVLNTTNKDYFLDAVEILAEKVVDPHFFIFSDDVEWCRQNLKLDYPYQVIGHEFKGYKFGNYMQLMKSCMHFIIPNSSFAWWSVWLNENPNKIVIAPKNWFNGQEYDTKDVTPSSWIKL